MSNHKTMTAKKLTTRYNTAMLIDDNEIDNIINEKMLESTGFTERIQVYTNGLSALEFLKNLERDKDINHDMIPDIIFLDINMPLMNSFQFLQEFSNLNKVITKDCKIAILTTSINPSDKERSLKNEYVIEFITKPLTKENLDKL